jgi:DNA primase
MKQFDNSAVAAVKARLNIVDIVRRYVDLRRNGTRWVAPCPFHQETKPSFSVNEAEGFFYCFGCQAAGDLIDFYKRVNGLEFRDALEQLAREAGVELGRQDPAEAARTRKEQGERQACLGASALAEEFYRRSLAGPAASACREYLERRRLSPEIIEHFGLGFSPADWSALSRFLKSKGVSDEVAVQAGLALQGQKGGVYDRFRDRLMFPIRNLSNQVVAFGGRIIKDVDEPKYINSNDSIIYKKGEHLYGLYQARRAMSATKNGLLTEGYMDVLTLHQYGYANACGVLGTALTPQQIKRLTGFCSNVDLLFDGDAAGRKAALRSAEMILTRGLSCRVVLMPEGEDVDSLLQQQGKEAFEAVLSRAIKGLDFCLQTVSATFSPREVLDWAKKFASQLDSSELLAFYLPRLASGLGLSETELRRAIPGAHAETVPAEMTQPQPEGKRRYGRFKEKDQEAERLKHGPKPGSINVGAMYAREVLSFAIRCPQFVPRLAETGVERLLAGERAMLLWRKILEAGDADLMPLLDEAQKRFYAQCRLQKSGMEEQEEREFFDICSKINEVVAKDEGRSVSGLLRSGDPSAQIELLGALQQSLGRKNG